jgi:hypothetical protein
MQALRTLVSRAGLLPAAKRSMTTAAQIAADAGKPKGSMVDTIGVYTVTPIAIGVFIYDVIYPEEEFEGEIPPYPYMRMRTRSSYPWGENGPFEVHRLVGEKP